MSDQIQEEGAQSDDSVPSAVSKACGAVSDFLTGTSIPAPIKRNAFKAFAQLCSAAVDIPVAYLEGKAAEKRAETEARIKIISTSAEEIAAQIRVDPEFARVAFRKFGQKIIREQINLNLTSEAAARELQTPTSMDEPVADAVQDTTINDDWLNNFEKEASQKSTEDMHQMFGRILAGEIRRPSTFSIRTVKLLGELDPKVAGLFRTLCSTCISLNIPGLGRVMDARVPSLVGSASSNSLAAYGLSFDQLNVLHEFGLIIPDYNSYFGYEWCIANEQNQVGLAFAHQKRLWGLVSSPERKKTDKLQIDGVALSSSGKELLQVVDTVPMENYTTALQEFFVKQNLRMAEIGLAPKS